MTRLVTQTALAAIALAFPLAPISAVSAADAPMMGNPSGPRIGQYADPAPIAALKGQLAIKPAQEAAWGDYAKVLQDTAITLRASRGQVRSLSAEEQQARQQKAFDAVKAAADKLLPALDAGQQTTAKQVLPGLQGSP